MGGGRQSSYRKRVGGRPVVLPIDFVSYICKRIRLSRLHTIISEDGYLKITLTAEHWTYTAVRIKYEF